MKIKNTNLNLTIDIIMFIVLMAIAGIGFMMKYVLLPGFERNQIYGSDVELYFWELDRHQWGNIHLIFGFILLFLFLLHIIFHWNMIIRIFKRMVQKKSMRIGLTTILIMFFLVFGMMPLFVQPEIQEAERRHFNQTENNSKNHQNIQFSSELKLNEKYKEATDSSIANKLQTEHFRNNSNQEKKHKRKEVQNIEVNGSMTLNEVSKKYNIPASELAICIHVPEKYSNERLGRLRKQYDFHMDDLRRYIEPKNKR